MPSQKMAVDENVVVQEGANENGMEDNNGNMTMVVEEMVDKEKVAEEKRIRITEKKKVAAERKNKKEKAGQDKRDSEEVGQVHELILECIERYMTKKETANHLYTSHLVPPACTKCSWMTLKEENEEFFEAYNIGLQICEQIHHFNKLINKMAGLFRQDGASSVSDPNCDASGIQSSLGHGPHLGSQSANLVHARDLEKLSDHELMEMLRNDSYGSRSFVDDYHYGNQEANLDNYNLISDAPSSESRHYLEPQGLHRLESQRNYEGVTCLISDMVNCNVQSENQRIGANGNNLVDGNQSIHVDNNGMLCPPYSEGRVDRTVDGEERRHTSTDDKDL